MNAPPHFDFANILFSGPCNARCPFCIGRQLPGSLTPDNLNDIPPRGLEAFLALIDHEGIRQVVMTGTNTDPQLYRHEGRLLHTLRRELSSDVQLALHTNGRLALQKIDLFNRYDRACISFPSFDPDIYRRVMGVSRPPDLGAILRLAAIPVKIACILTGHNRWDIANFLRRCLDLGIRRVVLRRPYRDPQPSPALPAGVNLQPAGEFRGSPVYDFEGMQVTLWDFERSTCRSINLFSSGEISREYLLRRDPAGL